MRLVKKGVFFIDTCMTFLSKKSQNMTPLLVIIFTFVSLTAGANEVLISMAKPIKSQQPMPITATFSQTDTDQLFASLQKDAIAIRRDNATIRVRYLRGGHDLPSAIRDLQSISPKLRDIQNKNALGPGSSGGGFSNYYSSYAKTLEDVTAMINQFRRMPTEVFNNYLPAKHNGVVTREKLIQALENIRFSFFQEGLTVAPNGMTDILEADYVVNSEESYIVLLKSFFEKYNSIAKNDQLSFMRARVILHEISHLFGIGVKDDHESFQFSFYLLVALATDERICVSTIDCNAPISLLRKQYSAVEYAVDSAQNLKKELAIALNTTGLKLNGLINHGITSDVMTRLSELKTINPDESVNVLIPSDLRDILPDDFKDIRLNFFGAELLASLSLQKNITFQNYVAYFKNKKSRWAGYSLTIFEAPNNILYSKQMDSINLTSNDVQKKIQIQFLSDRGDCYGEKAERPAYQWTFDQQNKICIGRP